MANALQRAFRRRPGPTRLYNAISNLLKPKLSKAVRSRLEPDEEPNYYHPGGFHRVHLGEQFHDGRYTILRKLGFGEYSTVWLARDLRTDRNVAIKVLRADAYGGKHDIFELDMLQAITRIAEKSFNPGREHVIGLSDHFRHNGPNGQHVCYVFNVLGCHLGFQSVQFPRGRLPVGIVKEIARQLLLGLDFLHRECGIIHTDLKPTNILLELANSEDAIRDYLSTTSPRLLRQPDTTQTNSLVDPTDELAIPLREIIPTPLITLMKKIRVRIVDFGVSSWTNQHLSDSIQSEFLRAPEVTIGAPWGPGVDIWSLGCLMIEFIKGHPAFPGKAAKSGAWSAEDNRLAQLMQVLGPFSPEFLSRGSKTKDFFDDKGNLLRAPKLGRVSLQRLLAGDKEPFLKPDDMLESEVPLYLDFVSNMLVLDPEKRKPAAEMLEHEWLRS